jgi:hypothetical protein
MLAFYEPCYSTALLRAPQPQLSRALLRLLLPGLPALSRAVQQHGWEGGQPPVAASSWIDLRNWVWTAASDMTCTALPQHLETMDGASAAAAVQGAVALLLHLPASHAAAAMSATEAAQMMGCAAALLGQLTVCLRRCSARSAGAEGDGSGSGSAVWSMQVKRQIVASMRPALGRLRALLAGAAADGTAVSEFERLRLMAGLCRASAGVLLLMDDVAAALALAAGSKFQGSDAAGLAADGAGGAAAGHSLAAAACSMEELPSWCQTACDALRMLSLLADAAAGAAAAARQMADADERFLACVREAPDNLATFIANFASQASMLCSEALTAAHAAGSSLSGGSLAALQAALWQLHTAACRLVHWADGGGSAEVRQQLLQGLPCLQLRSLLLGPLNHSQAAACSLQLIRQDLQGAPRQR